MDTEKQRQRRRDGARLTESGNARSEQLLVVPTESLTNRQWLLGELLSGSERQRPGWFLDMKCQTCLVIRCFLKSQQTAISSLMELHESISCHVTVLCACIQIIKWHPE